MSAVTEAFVELEVVFNGQAKVRQANIHQPLRSVFQQALAEFGLHPAQPDEYGLFLQGAQQPLELDRKIEDLGLAQGTVLMLQRRTPPRGGWGAA